MHTKQHNTKHGTIISFYQGFVPGLFIYNTNSENKTDVIKRNRTQSSNCNEWNIRPRYIGLYQTLYGCACLTIRLITKRTRRFAALWNLSIAEWNAPKPCLNRYEYYSGSHISLCCIATRR
jgi:hypothetical protein